MNDPEQFVAVLIERFFAIAWIIFGVSHIVQPERCDAFFADLSKSRAAGLIVGAYTLPFGLLFILGHNRWEFGWPLVVTIGGWMMTLKSVVYLWVPLVADRVLERAGHRAGAMRWAGVPLLLLGVGLSWHVFIKP